MQTVHHHVGWDVAIVIEKLFADVQKVDSFAIMEPRDDRVDFRDFVLSRVQLAEQLEESAESNPEYDDDWMEPINLQLSPHPKLTEAKRQILMTDYAAVDNVIEFTVWCSERKCDVLAEEG